MTNTHTRFLRTAVAIGGLAATGALLVPGAASAQPGPGGGPLSGTTCTSAQIEAAVRDQAPELAARFDADPARKVEMQELRNLPAEERKQRIQERLAADPELRARIEERHIDPNSPEMASKIEKMRLIAEACHNY